MKKDYLNVILVSYLRGYVDPFRYQWYRAGEVENGERVYIKLWLGS